MPAVIATWLDEERTQSVELLSDGTLVTKQREDSGDIWPPPSKPLTMHSMADVVIMHGGPDDLKVAHETRPHKA